jgi:very-short-patch-repair endonuclease
LGCSGSPAILAASLDRLADHVQAILHFEADPDAARLLGDHWQGLHSPFDETAAGARLRRAIFGQLESFPVGDRIAERITALPAPAFAALADLAGTARLIQEATECLRGLDRTPINVTVPALRAELAAYQRFLSADPERSLAGIDALIEDIAEIATILAQKAATTRNLAASPVAHAIRALGETEADIDRTERAIEWIEAVQRAVPPGRRRDALMGPEAEAVRQLVREAAAAGAALSRSYRAMTGHLSSAFGIDQLADLLPEALIRRLDLLLAHRVELADFLALRDDRCELDQAGLADFLARCDRIGLAPDRLPAVFETLVAHAQADIARRASPEFAHQGGATLEALRRRFADRDRAKIASDRAAIAAKLLQRIPPRGSDIGPRGAWTDMALLRNEFPKQRRFAPVRSLLSRAGGAVQSLKPCFMMSPLSLAKFARPEQLAFDILLVDEASQMKPEEALGALIRAKQVVVVGDAKQLPPTDFFNRSVEAPSADDDFEDIDDESILEACEKTFRQVRSLKWHYRSRCESLISFSNAEFYENSLVTFPMARPGSFSIDLVRVDGAYQARRNAAEAVRVAEEAIQFMRYFADMSEATIPSLGIVSINIDQRDLIDEELRRVWAGDELVDRYREKVQQKGEPLFVKNLENVQGDERDFIFISMTYGREPGATALKQRFGPINGKQGHRRLNVLFSRARMRIALFTSFGSVDVRPGELSADGPRVLKRFLEYAETRGRAVVESITNEPDSDFEVEVGKRLRAKGYELDFQVGVSGYKIDLAVRHPDHAERFLAGIECDGARYHSTKSARDRDRLREEVLDGLGWAILHVWSTDWFDNPEVETDKLVVRLENLRLGPPRTFPDYQMMDAFGQDEPDPAEPHSVNGADGAAAVAEGRNPVPPSPGLPANEEPILSDDGSLTPGQAYKVLEDFRESVIKPAMENWEPHRSILRDGMIETFVTQRFDEPGDWFNKVPQFQRPGTNPLEKTLFLARICEIVERIDDGAPGRHPRAEPYALTPPIAPGGPGQAPLPFAPVMHAAPPSADLSRAEPLYVIADIANLSLIPRPDRFYERDYKATIGRIAGACSSIRPHSHG